MLDNGSVYVVQYDCGTNKPPNAALRYPSYATWLPVAGLLLLACTPLSSSGGVAPRCRWAGNNCFAVLNKKFMKGETANMKRCCSYKSEITLFTV